MHTGRHHKVVGVHILYHVLILLLGVVILRLIGRRAKRVWVGTVQVDAIAVVAAAQVASVVRFVYHGVAILVCSVGVGVGADVYLRGVDQIGEGRVMTVACEQRVNHSQEEVETRDLVAVHTGHVEKLRLGLLVIHLIRYLQADYHVPVGR